MFSSLNSRNNIFFKYPYLLLVWLRISDGMGWGTLVICLAVSFRAALLQPVMSNLRGGHRLTASEEWGVDRIAGGYIGKITRYG
jgi:hypothetical protein